MPGRTLIIINPAAKHGLTADMLPVVEQLIGDSLEYDVLPSQRPEHARELAARTAGYDVVVALGGDGTVHEVTNGLMSIPPEERPALGILPTGSGNDYARTVGVSFHLPTAVRQLIEDKRRRFDVGRINNTWFCNSIGLGLDARVTAKAVEMKVTTGWSGLPLYLRSLLFVLFKQYYGHDIELGFDGEEPGARRILLMAVSNGETYGGGFFITPHAVPDDGLFDVCIIDDVSVYQALWRIPFVIPGKHTWMKVVHMSRHHSLLVRSAAPLPCQVDGEVMLADSYDISIEQRALEVVCRG